MLISAATLGFQVRRWHKQPESMNPFCLISAVQAGDGGVMVWVMYSWLTLRPSVPAEYSLSVAYYLSIAADYVHSFMSTVDHLLMATSSRINLRDKTCRTPVPPGLFFTVYALF